MRYRPTNMIGRKPVDWEREMKRPKWDVMAIGAGLFVFGAALMVASFFAWEILAWFRQRDFGILVIGNPVSAPRIIGGLFALIGVFIVWVGLPQRSRS